MRLSVSFLLLLVFIITGNSWAAIHPNPLFQSYMVLQRDKRCAIWGTANKGESMTLSFNNATYKTTAGKDGKWKIIMPAHAAGGPYTLTLSGSDTVTLSNVLFGDVWLCGGQSNMQFKVSEMHNNSIDTNRYNNSQIRLITIPAAPDYTPQDTVKGGTWRTATNASVQDFSAVGFFFGEYVQTHIGVPVGLISDNLGGTAVETWMSNGAIKELPQFAGYYNRHLAAGKSYKQLQDAFEKYKLEWNRKYYFANDPGIGEKWYLPQTDTTGWKATDGYGYWEDKGLPDYDGSVWYRRSFDLPDKYDRKGISLGFGTIDDYSLVWVNGKKVGETYGNMNVQGYNVPDSLLQPKNNTLVIRIFDAGGKGGMNFWWFPKWTSDYWLYKPGVKIDTAKFVRPDLPNANPYSSPAILYNANIAPVTPLSIKGFIWYQGESNTDRAEEYKQLFPAMIQDWRTQFKQGDLPFLFVQLANYDNNGKPDSTTYAELREAQASTLSLPNTGMASAIDIGEAGDIHPKNKVEVGKRLGIAAMKVAYGQDSTHLSPSFTGMKRSGDSILIQTSAPVFTTDKYGYIRGFFIAGSDSIFHPAQAYANSHTITVYRRGLPNPLAVRYAWTNNPGTLDLYSREGLPLLPFRTDNRKTSTAGKKFSYTE